MNSEKNLLKLHQNILLSKNKAKKGVVVDFYKLIK
jgi:hypothetical protein